MTDSQSPRNVLLIVLDSCRAANIPLYGYQRDTTPTLRDLSTTATTYLQARAPSNWTVPSHISLFTGLEAHQHQFTNDNRLGEGHTVFESLEQDGYRTGLFTGNSFLTDRETGIPQVFTETVDSPSSPPAKYTYGDIEERVSGFWYADRFLDWVDNDDQQWAACLSLMDTHRFYEPQDEYDLWGDDEAHGIQNELDNVLWEFDFYGGHEPRWKLSALEELYDGSIRQADAVVGEIIEGLEQRGQFDETLIVITADHGEGFGELPHTPGAPPSIGHAVPVHEVNLHVPLLVKAPGQQTSHTVPTPATPSLFPNAVETLRSEMGADDGAFSPSDRPVIASRQPASDAHVEQAKKRCENASELLQQGRAVYVPTPLSTPAVTKYSQWGDTTCELSVHGARAITSATRINGEFVEKAFGSFDPVDIT